MKDSLIPEKEVAQTRGANMFRRLRTIAVSILVIAFCAWLVLEWERTRVSVMGGSADPWYHRIMALSRPAPPFPVIDSGFEVSNAPRSEGKIAWVDNERVLFIGVEPGRTRTNENGQVLPMTGLYLWNVSSREVRRWRDEEIAGICVADVFVRYMAWQGGTGRLYVGKFGEEREIENHRAQSFNRFTCRDEDPNTTMSNPTGTKVPLKDGHGTLLFGPSSHANVGPLIYFSAERHDPIYLPVQNWQVEPSNVTYSEFRRAYVLYSGFVEPGRSSNWPIDTSRPVRLLHPGGDLEVIEIPYGPWISEGGSRIQLSAKGLVWGQSYESSPRRKAERGGAYLFDGTKVFKLLRGEPTAFVVSPNGCKLAMSVNSDYPVWRNRLVLINVCNGGQTK